MGIDQFLKAIYDGNDIEVQRLIASGVNVNELGHYPSFTERYLSLPIIVAAEKSNFPLMMQLLDLGANPNYREQANYYRTALGMAVANGADKNVIERLLRANADINKVDGLGYTALYKAISRNCSDMVNFFIEKGADPNCGKSTLQAGIQSGNPEIVRQLLKVGVNSNVTWGYDDIKDTPLITAARYCEKKDSEKHEAIVDMLIQAGVPIDQANAEGVTALAAGANNTHVVKSMLVAGANPNPPTAKGHNTPLSVACSAGNLEAVNLLLTAGADHTKSGHGINALLALAAKSGNPAVVTKLSLLGVKGASTALREAAAAGAGEALQRLLEMGTDMNEQSASGYSALDWAIRKGHIDEAATLVTAGAQLSGKRPLAKLLTIDDQKLLPLLRAMIAPDFRARLADAVRTENPSLAQRITEIPPGSSEEKALLQVYARAQLALSNGDKNGETFPNGLASLLQTSASFTELRDMLKAIPLEQFTDMKDMHNEFATYVLLPSLLIQSGIAGQDKQLRKIKPLPLITSLMPVAASFLANGRDLLSYLKFSESWHQPHHAFPSDRLRPLADKDAAWHPLTEQKEYSVPAGKPAAGWHIRVLTTAEELKDEGAALKHCVGGSDYSTHCLAGACHILSIRDPEGNRVSTAELDTHLEGQHRAEKNSIPPEAARQARDWFVQAVRNKDITLSAQRGETAASKLKRRGPAVLRAIGFRPDWDNVDAALRHYQTTVTVKHKVPEAPSKRSSYPGGGWRKSIIPTSSRTTHFNMEPLVSGHRFVPDTQETAAGTPCPTGETKFFSAIGAQELMDASGLTNTLCSIAEKHGLDVASFASGFRNHPPQLASHGR